MVNFKVKDLKAHAKKLGIKGYYRMRKAELTKRIEEIEELPIELVNVKIEGIEIFEKKMLSQNT